MVIINEAIETLRYEIDEECHCDYIADELRCLISAYESLIAQEEKAHQYCKNVCEPKHKAEIERLRTSNNALRMANELCKGWEERAKAKAIKEFAERLKRTDLALCGKVVWCEYIDNLVKEMVGDDK